MYRRRRRNRRRIVGVPAISRLSVGRLSIGWLTIWRLSIRRLSIWRLSVRRLTVNGLTIGRLRIVRLILRIMVGTITVCRHGLTAVTHLSAVGQHHSVTHGRHRSLYGLYLPTYRHNDFRCIGDIAKIQMAVHKL